MRRDVATKETEVAIVSGVVVHAANIYQHSLGRINRRRGVVRGVLLLAALLGPTWAAHGQSTRTRTSNATSRSQSTDQLSFQVNNDRMTLAITKVPQIYLFGNIDADAPARFEALIRSGKIPNGSDIYLNSPGGDLHAGMALCRLFRFGAMVTHLGTPRRALRSTTEPKTAVCVNACTYAYLGGVYRWAPTGNDRIGLLPLQGVDPKATSVTQSTADAVAYLKEMGIDSAVFAPTPKSSPDEVVWFSAEQMMSTGLANNGRLPLTLKYTLSAGAPYLVLDQTDRNGEHRITLLCKPGGVTLTAYDMVGADRARQIVARGTRSYFEVNQQETLSQPRDGVVVANESVMMSRSYPPTQLGHLLLARSVGAWVGDSNRAFRYGFAIELESVRSALKEYYVSCWEAAPWPTNPTPTASAQ
jgi:hypothetical protein